MTVIFERAEDVEAWYWCATCERNSPATAWDWNDGGGKGPRCSCGAYYFDRNTTSAPAPCNWGIQHSEPDNIDDLSDCVADFNELGFWNMAHGCDNNIGPECPFDFEHTLVEIKEETTGGRLWTIEEMPA